jgi:hypothetical protein
MPGFIGPVDSRRTDTDGEAIAIFEVDRSEMSMILFSPHLLPERSLTAPACR